MQLQVLQEVKEEIFLIAIIIIVISAACAITLSIRNSADKKLNLMKNHMK